MKHPHASRCMPHNLVKKGFGCGRSPGYSYSKVRCISFNNFNARTVIGCRAKKIRKLTRIEAQVWYGAKDCSIHCVRRANAQDV